MAPRKAAAKKTVKKSAPKKKGGKAKTSSRSKLSTVGKTRKATRSTPKASRSVAA